MKSLTLENISAGYRNKTVLKNVNFSIAEGENLLIEGPNGTGKTTLLKTLAGILKPVSGRFQNSFSRIGYVPQIRNLDAMFPATVEECLRISLLTGFPERGITLLKKAAFCNGSQKSSNQRKIDEAVQITGLENKKNKPLRECSGGEFQRVLIARSLLHTPDLLILDEPMSFLDRTGKESLSQLLKTLKDKQHTTIVMTGHEEFDEGLFSSIVSVENGLIIKTSAHGNKI